MRFRSLLIAAGLTCSAFSQVSVGGDSIITSSRLKAHLEFIASDEMEGRDTPSRGLDTATLYIATQLKLWGAKPAGDNGTFFQTIDLSQFDPNLKNNPRRFARNVVAIVPGTDSIMSREYVAFGAHIDHLGLYNGSGEDKIFNGADDDGSGTVAILEIAHAFLTGPRPKRSALFVWHIGEEKGLWGSNYYVEHPTVDLSKIVTQLNIDMIGRSRPANDKTPSNGVLTGPNEIYVVGSTKMSSDLQKASEISNRNYLNLKFNYKYDDPKDPEQIFYRSDHYNYARKGVPIIFYFDGVHQDYHGLDDEVDRIDFTKMVNVTRTVYALGFTLANNEKRPVVDKPLGG